jgi:hypothetical protein
MGHGDLNQKTAHKTVFLWRPRRDSNYPSMGHDDLKQKTAHKTVFFDGALGATRIIPRWGTTT